jgi:hypothetical protein
MRFGENNWLFNLETWIQIAEDQLSFDSHLDPEHLLVKYLYLIMCTYASSTEFEHVSNLNQNNLEL